MKYRIRFNKSRGQPERGSMEVPSRSEQEGPDWNIVCEGTMLFFYDTDTAVIQ